MTAEPAQPLPAVFRSVLRLQLITVVWMGIEAVASIGTAWHARSPALFAFGGDSLIELLSAAVVFSRFRFHFDEIRATRITGGLLFALAALVILTSILSLKFGEAQRTLFGIGILLAAAVAMPVLAKRKQSLALVTSSAALRADAVESALCGYMALIGLAGLIINGASNKSWADPVAALALTPLILKEGWEAVKLK